MSNTKFMLNLTQNQKYILVGILIVVILILLFNHNKESFETVCTNGQCVKCTNSIFRKNYCYESPVIQTCPDGYSFNNDTRLCHKNVNWDYKDYDFQARPNKTCSDPNQIMVDNTCVSYPETYFDPNYH